MDTQLETQNSTAREEEVSAQETPTQSSTQSGSSNANALGPKIGIIIIVGLLIVGGLYMFSTTKKNNNLNINNATTTLPEVKISTPADQPAQIDQTINSFDTAQFDAQINADLNAIDTIVK